MTPREFNAARHLFGLGRKDFGTKILGFTGDPRNIWVTVKRWENGERAIPENIQRLVQLTVWFKEDYGYLPDLDNGRREPMEIPKEFADE
jgi:hypothetical protein